jgi:ribonuclease-3
VFVCVFSGMVVTYPGMKPCSVRVDQLDREQQKTNDLLYPEIVHFGIRPPQLSYAGNPEYVHFVYEHSLLIIHL